MNAVKVVKDVSLCPLSSSVSEDDNRVCTVDRERIFCVTCASEIKMHPVFPQVPAMLLFCGPQSDQHWGSSGACNYL